VRAAENHIAHKALNMPRLVRAATPPDQR
jgi:hypothetical protein